MISTISKSVPFPCLFKKNKEVNFKYLFSDLKINIDAAVCAEAPDGRAENVFRFHAKHLDELTDVTRKMESMRGVHGVTRVRD